jgi:hypothetical protein
VYHRVVSVHVAGSGEGLQHFDGRPILDNYAARVESGVDPASIAWDISHGYLTTLHRVVILRSTPLLIVERSTFDKQPAREASHQTGSLGHALYVGNEQYLCVCALAHMRASTSTIALVLGLGAGQH